MSELSDAVAKINAIYCNLPYDHRPRLDPSDEQIMQKRSDAYRVRYACFKYAVAVVLVPRFILEIGVGSGISALAFSSALERLHYIGIDNGEWTTRLGVPFLTTVESKLREDGLSFELIHKDTRTMTQFPQTHLVHIDGDHSFEAARHDMELAWRSGAPWILVDDARDSAVVAGIFYALKHDLDRGDVDWAYFPDTWGGDILIRTDHRLDP